MRCFARMASGMKDSLFNTNCHELPVNFRKYFYFLTLISRKPQMTLITLIIWSTEFKLIAQIFARRYALATQASTLKRLLLAVGDGWIVEQGSIWGREAIATQLLYFT